jgi:GNAT superfamily N-acetyltransferase
MPSKPLPPLPVTVIPARAEQWPDVETIFNGVACWCQSYRATASGYGRVTKEELFARALADRRAAMRRQLAAPTPPGLLAYSESEVVGWCGLGPRATFQRLMRSRTIPLVDDRPVWSIVCFLVRTGYRRRGVAGALLQGAITCAREHQAPALEAYPVDPQGKRISTSFAYVGTTALFERAGFYRVQETSAKSAGLTRWLMRLEL